jgi:UDP-N-acetylmuramyl pentapeptide phosphotransferase/UDP-N-acetylglucosamine-1-phosphate transferase
MTKVRNCRRLVRSIHQKIGYKRLVSADPASLYLALIFGLCLAASLALTGLLRRWLLSRQILDRPNERSAHTMPVPRGGGIAILLVLLSVWAWIEPGLWLVLLAGAGLAAAGWWDDVKGLGPWPKLIAQAIAVAIGLHFLGPVTRGWLAAPLDLLLAGFAWLWFVNAFNFMDGIDGIAGVEAISIALGLTVLGLWFASYGDLAALATALAGAVLGFLFWNWHPARIFLGDVGSQGLGYLIGFLLLRVASDGAWAAALILPLYFLADASFTLLKRLKAGKNIMSAHADHIYQESVRRGRSHAQVATAVLIANVALVLFALGAEMGERPISLAGAALTIVVLARRLLTPPLSASQSN